MEGETQREWDEYRQRKRAERLFEADQVWSALASGGAGSETVLAIDFVTFGAFQEQIERLGQQLAENCTVTTEPGPSGYWLLKGTTRPYGVTLSATDHLAWVEFMCDVAADHGCVFSAWSLSAPSLDLTISSEAFEGITGEEHETVAIRCFLGRPPDRGINWYCCRKFSTVAP